MVKFMDEKINPLENKNINADNKSPSKQLDADFDEALRLLSFDMDSVTEKSSDSSQTADKTADFDAFLESAKSEIEKTAEESKAATQEILNSDAAVDTLPSSPSAAAPPESEPAAASAEESEETDEISKYLDELTPVTDAEGAVVKDNRTIRKERTVFFTFVILTILMLAFLIFYILIGSSGRYGIGIDIDPDMQNAVFEAPQVFKTLKPNEKEGIQYPEGIQEKYKRLYAAHQDFVGWLRIPGTPVDTPIYQAKDNTYYLKRDLAGNYSKYGTPFLDYTNRVDKLSRNTVIYGHNFEPKYENDLGFGGIEQYKDVEFYKKHPVIEFNTLYKDYKWKVFACFLSNGDPSGNNGYLFNYIATSMGNNSFLKFIDEVMQRSFIQTSVDIKETDKILTISTCAYDFDRGGRLEDLRCVVMARLVREGESEEVDTSKAVQRTDIRYPQLYYDIFGGTNPYKNALKWYPSAD